MKKKGFTLVELLGVICVLAIILIVAVPKINNYIVSSKKQTFINNALNIVRQLEYDKMEFMTFKKEFIMDLSEVKFMDSSGIGLLIGRYNLIKFMDSKMVILNPTNSIKRILELSNISDKILVRCK